MTLEEELSKQMQ